MKERSRTIDLDRWPRREHCEFFRGYRFPFFSITTAIDITSLRDTLKERAPSFTIGLVYVLARAANAVPQFRQRIREDEPVEHEIVHPSLTVLCEGDVFRFSLLRNQQSFDQDMASSNRLLPLHSHLSIGNNQVEGEALFPMPRTAEFRGR